MGRALKALATAAGAALSLAAANAWTGPPAKPAAASDMPQISPEAGAIASAGAREVGAGDADEDATLAAQADAEASGPLAIAGHEAALRQVLADMPDPFVRRGTQGQAVTYRGDSMADCLAFTATLPRPAKVVCKGNPYPAAAFYLGSYYNELHRPEDALAVLDRGLVAGPNAALLLAERNAALIALQRWDDVLAGADRGLALQQLAPRDHALMLRNRGYALTELKRLDEAQQAYEQSLRFEPGNALAKNELTYIAGLKAGSAATPGQIFLPNRPPKSN